MLIFRKSLDSKLISDTRRFELFLLGDGEKKVAEEVDTRKVTLSYDSSFQQLQN